MRRASKGYISDTPKSPYNACRVRERQAGVTNRQCHWRAFCQLQDGGLMSELCDEAWLGFEFAEYDCNSARGKL